MAKRIITDAQREQIATLREAGSTYPQIAASVGCSTSSVSWYCLMLGAEPPKPTRLRLDYHLVQPMMKRGNGFVRAFTPDEDTALLALERQGKRVREIARALGRKDNSIRGRLMTLARREERLAP